MWRVLRQRTPGFYVDVGAMDPVIDSVTKVYYEHGWHGIDIEPHPALPRRSERLASVTSSRKPPRATRTAPWRFTSS